MGSVDTILDILYIKIMNPLLILLFGGGFIIGKNLPKIREVTKPYTKSIENIAIKSSNTAVHLVVQNKDHLSPIKLANKLTELFSMGRTTDKRKSSQKLAGKIKKFRIRKGISQIELSNITSMSLYKIKRIESGKYNITPNELKKISNALEATF